MKSGERWEETCERPGKAREFGRDDVRGDVAYVRLPPLLVPGTHLPAESLHLVRCIRHLDRMECVCVAHERGFAQHERLLREAHDRLFAPVHAAPLWDHESNGRVLVKVAEPWLLGCFSVAIEEDNAAGGGGSSPPASVKHSVCASRLPSRLVPRGAESFSQHLDRVRIRRHQGARVQGAYPPHTQVVWRHCPPKLLHFF